MIKYNYCIVDNTTTKDYIIKNEQQPLQAGRVLSSNSSSIWNLVVRNAASYYARFQRSFQNKNSSIHPNGYGSNRRARYSEIESVAAESFESSHCEAAQEAEARQGQSERAVGYGY